MTNNANVNSKSRGSILCRNKLSGSKDPAKDSISLGNCLLLTYMNDSREREKRGLCRRNRPRHCGWLVRMGPLNPTASQRPATTSNGGFGASIRVYGGGMTTASVACMQARTETGSGKCEGNCSLAREIFPGKFNERNFLVVP